MLIPLGQERSTVRRIPWVAFAIIAVNLTVALPLFVSASASEEAIHAAGRKVVRYLVDHPYLEPPRTLTPLLDPELLTKLAEVRGEYRESGEIPQQSQLGEEQAQLEQHTSALLTARAGSPWRRLGFVPAEPRPAALLTHMFVHSGWLHLLGNMLMFFVLGPFLEDVFGRPLFMVVYLLSGLLGVGAHAVYYAGSTVPMVGASGAIAGVMGAFLVRLGASRIRFLFLPLGVLPFFRVHLLLPGYLVLPVWFVAEHWSASQAVETGVAHWAHVGGFAGGLVLAGIVRLTGVEERWIDRAIESKVSLTQDPAIERADAARLAGDLARARLEIRKALAASPTSLDAWREALDIGLDAADTGEVERAGLRLLELYPRAGEHELARRLVHDVVEQTPELASPKLTLAAAGYLERSGDMGGALALYERVLGGAPGHDSAVMALFRSGEICRRGGDSVRAREFYEKARHHPCCQGHWPQRIEAALAALPA
jgi:membrane associated rhomboid family serine protease